MQHSDLKKIKFSIFASILMLSGCVFSVQKEPTAQSYNQTETQNVRIYFSSTKDNENMLDCSYVDSVKRTINNDKEKYTSILQELFKGPTEQEKQEGLQPFWITEDTSSYLISVTLEKETAYVNWKDLRTLIPNASASCGSQTFLMPVEKTLTQFPEIKKIVHQIEGGAEAFYEWMQYDTMTQ